MYSQYNAFLEQAAAQGQTVVSAAGDNGSTDCYGQYKTSDTADNEQLAVDFPASSQYVTAMGGTEFSAADVASTNSQYFDAQSTSDIISSAKSYIPEMVWNDDVAAVASSCPGSNCSPISAGGGGVSIYTAQPSWQAGTVGGVSISTSGGKRMLPDIALTASPYNAPFAFCTSDTTFWSSGQKASCNNGLRDASSGTLTVGGGTSFDAPTFSALIAIINQKENSTGQGLINPTLYSLAASSAYASAFHDITSGGNQCLSGASYCAAPATTDYAATTGYDEASGLGSIDFYNLLNAWPSSTTASLLSTTTTLTAATSTPAAGATDVITITVAPISATTSVPSGTVSLSVDGGSTTSLPFSQGVATYNFSSTTTGAHVLTAAYSGDTLFAASSGSLTIDVGGSASTGTFAVAANPANVTVAPGSSATGTITLSDPSGSTFSGTVTLSSSASTLTVGCVVLGSTSVALNSTTPGTVAYTIYTSSSACTAAGAARPGILRASGSTPRGPSSPWKQMPVPASLAGAVVLLGLRRSRRLRSRLMAAGLTLGLVFVLSFSGAALTGCGGSSATTTTTTTTTTTPAGTYTITINGVSGTTTGSATITLTVS